MITFGQAACLILGDPPTDENRKKAIEYVATTKFTIRYRRGEDPFRPIAVGRKLAEQDPFTYLSYPETPPSSPTLHPVLFDAENTNLASEVSSASASVSAPPEQENPQSDESAGSFADKPTGVPINKAHVLDLLAQITFLEDPGNREIYDRKLMEEKDVFELLRQYFPKIEDVCSERKVGYWMSLDERWGQTKRLQSDSGRVKGRWLWVVKPKYRKFQQENESNEAYVKHVNAVAGCWVTVGYARKSPSAESDQTRQRLLQLMIKRLQLKGRCQRVYVTPVCTAASPILERDCPRVSSILNELKDCKGDLTDLTAYLPYCVYPVRLVVIDYAGLSTNIADIRTFVRLYEQISEIVVDHGHKMEAFSRFELLNNDDAIQRFNCRKQPVRRSSLQRK